MSRMLKPTVLSLSLLTVMSGAAVAPALARIAAAFPTVTPTSIKLILTLPAVFIIIFSLLAGRLSACMSKRQLLIIGLIVYLIGGLAGGFATRFELLLVARAVLGVGVGLIMPLATGLIADFYQGEERARLMGYSAAASQLGGIIATLSSGLLAAYSWRYSFGVYGASLPVLVLVLLFLPNPQTAERSAGGHAKLPKAVYGWAASAFLLMLAFYAIPINLAIFLENSSLGGASSSGLAIAVVTAGGFLAGLSFAKLKQALQGLLPALLFALLSLGYLLLSQAGDFFIVLLAAASVGLGLGWTMPLLFTNATKAGGEGLGVPTMALVTSMIFLGQFLSPLVLDYVGRLCGDSSPRFVFALLAGVFAILLVSALGHWLFRQRTT